MRDDDVAELLRSQDGVAARSQLRALEVTDNDIERKVRRREWSRIHPGVYVDHTGPLTWSQRAWAAVLFYAPAALSGRSALRAWKVRNHRQADDGPVHVCVDASRTVRSRPSVRIERIAGWDEKCLLNLSPPRLRLEHALVSEASTRAGADDALAVLADAVQQGRTTVDRLVSALAERRRLRHRGLLLEILQDVRTGAYSVLEHRYLVHVERPHGLPTAARQRRVRSGKSAAFRDVDYLESATVVELDGRLGHEEAVDRWADLDRDLASAIDGALTLRAGWRQVLDPCRLAFIVGRILGSRGWTSTLRGCRPGCPVADLATSSAPGAEEVAASLRCGPAGP